MSPGFFRTLIALRPGADMTFDAAHMRVRGNLIGDELRLHRFMACLAAELDRLSMFIRPIAPKSAHEYEDHSQTQEGEQRTPAIRIVEVDPRKRCDLIGREPPSPPPLV